MGKFENQWKSDIQASQKLTNQAKTSKLPAGDVALVNQADAIDKDADVEVNQLDSGWGDVEHSGKTLKKGIEDEVGAVEKILRDSDAVQADAEEGLDTFNDGMQPLQIRLSALKKEITRKEKE
ncbi:hypothetical protein RRG08_022974 [Elysia crispata]|uniref:Uncharacterized protein n=1 Tax=Elysia crispata TaxID=231223 RepID=A0AAE1AEW1_9GAST|nr:hypothetical protein RRG08_022974 [Elysia crispata]